MANFSATVSQWCANTEIALDAIFRESAQRVFHEMTRSRAAGGSHPFDTGFAIASWRASTSQMPEIIRGSVGEKGRSYAPSGQVELTIATAKLGDTIYIGGTASYLPRLNYGFSGTDSAGRHFNQSGYLFVEKAAQKWPSIVKQVEAELSAKVR